MGAALLVQVREIRLVRREGRSSVCLVLLRFDAQTSADGFYRDFNGRPVRCLQLLQFVGTRSRAAILPTCMHPFPPMASRPPLPSPSPAVLPAGAGAAVPLGVCQRCGVLHCWGGAAGVGAGPLHGLVARLWLAVASTHGF